MKAWTLVGYVYRADLWCPACMRIRALADAGQLGFYVSDGIDTATTEDVLSDLAALRSIDREDEKSFDSDDFPKVLLADSTDQDDRCCRCGRLLIDEYDG